jgi:pilus assembly protein CpaB
LVVLLAVVFGGSASIGIHALRNPGPTDAVSVVVAAADLPRGRSVTADLLTTRDYPKDLVPAGAILSKEEAVDRTVFIPLGKDEPLIDSKLASRSAGRGLAPLIPAGMRACTITTNVSSSVAGFILPGNRVDVLLSMSIDGDKEATGGATTTTLLQNVEILAIDQNIEAPAANVAPNQRSATLLVTPDQAAKLQLGQTKGQLHLTLRNPGDDQEAKTRPATARDIQFYQGKPWHEGLKGVLEGYAKMMAAQKAKEPAREVVKPAAAPQEFATIRTLRGTVEGVAVVRP